jgi:hypothetical protein
MRVINPRRARESDCWDGRDTSQTRRNNADENYERER